MNATPTIKCKSCHGSGEVKLPDYLLRTLRLFRGAKKFTPEDALTQLREAVTASAVSTRLRELCEMGLLTRERRGRAWAYSQKRTDFRPNEPRRAVRPE